jgi:hypothetical protein
MNQVASKPVGPIGISKTIIQQAGDTLRLPDTAKIVKAADPKKDIVTKIISPKSKPENVNAVWAEAAKIQNSIIPGEVNNENKDGGNKFQIGDKEIQLGGSKDLKTDSKTVSIDTISTPEQQNALKTQIKAATSSTDLKKITAPDTDDDKRARQENIKKLNTSNETTNVNLLDDDKNTIANLDKNRAELNKRGEEIRLASKNTNLTDEQKTALKTEQKALDESLKAIDAVPKVFATQNGARLKVDNGSNIRSINKSQITSNDKLDGYEGMFQAKDEKNQTEVKVPTVKQAYDSFTQQMKESTGKDFTLGDKQNLVMYRDGDNVKFLIVDSKTETTGNRKTIITEPIIAKREENGETAIKKPLVKKSGTSGQETVEFSAKQFNYGAGDAATIDGAGEDIKINLVKDGTSTTSFFGADKPTSSDVKQTNTNNYPNFALNKVKITANLADATTYDLELPKDTLRLLSSMTTNRAPLSSYFEIGANNYRITGLDKTHLDEMNKELKKRPYLKAAITHLNGGGKLSDVLLSKEITKDELQNTQYAEDINNPRYKALITYITKPENNDGKAIIRDLQENHEILPPWVDLINAGINTP